MEKKSEKDKRRLGKQAPRYRFFLNPYWDTRFNSCPQCGNKTGQKKLPLFIHIDPQQQLLLNKTCRYCAHCDLLIVHSAIYRMSQLRSDDRDGRTLGVSGKSIGRSARDSLQFRAPFFAAIPPLYAI